MKGYDIISIEDLNDQEVQEVLSLASRMKSAPERYRQSLAGRSMSMLFEKPSLRTRVTFEVGIASLGGYAVYMGPTDVALGKREAVEDVARNLDRWVDLIVARVFEHRTLETLARYSKAPVINALSDTEHPCQALADIMTILEHKKRFAGVKCAFIGDANNVCYSLFLVASRMGMKLAQGGPKDYHMNAELVESIRNNASKSGGSIAIFEDPVEAIRDADVVYTDIWTSMGQESQKNNKDKAFEGYQVNSTLMAHAKPDAIFMHCLPAHRGEEVTSEVLDSPQSVVFDQAENRLHAQKALILKVLGGDVEGAAQWQRDTTS